MKHFLFWSAVLVLVLLLGATNKARAGQLLYVTSTTGKQVLTADTGTNQVTPVFDTVGNPDSLIFDTHGNIIYSSVLQGQVRSYNPSTKIDTLLGGLLEPLGFNGDAVGPGLHVREGVVAAFVRRRLVHRAGRSLCGHDPGSGNCRPCGIGYRSQKGAIDRLAQRWRDGPEKYCGENHRQERSERAV